MSKYTEENITVILNAIKNGVPIKKACHLIGIKRDTFYKWLKDDTKDLKERVLKARTEKMLYLLSLIRTAGLGEMKVKCPGCVCDCGKTNRPIEFKAKVPKNWQPLAWILERTERDDFALYSKVKHELPPGTDEAIESMAKGLKEIIEQAGKAKIKPKKKDEEKENGE